MAAGNGTEVVEQAGLVPHGRQLVGRFVEVRQVARADGTPVRGMFEVCVSRDGARESEWPMRASFFRTDREGDPTKMAQALDACNPAPGDLVSVRVTTTATVSKDGKAYSNDEAVGFAILAL